MTAQETFEAFVRDGIWPRLKELGFKRTRGTFHRAAGANWEVVNLQRSSWSDARSIEFTVNLAIAYDSLQTELVNWAPGKRPPEYRCHVRERLGILLRGEDAWWEVRARADTAMLADSIATAVEQFGLPWLEERSSEERVMALLADPARMSAEPWHHLQRFEQLAEQFGRADLAQLAAAEIRRQESAPEQRPKRRAN